MPSDIGIASYFGQSALIYGYHRLGYSIFTDPNEKFINVDVRAFVKSDAREPHFGKSSFFFLLLLLCMLCPKAGSNDDGAI